MSYSCCHSLPHGFCKLFWDHYWGVPDPLPWALFKQSLFLVCLPNCCLIICVQSRTVSTMNYLKSWAVGLVLALNLIDSFGFCTPLYLWHFSFTTWLSPALFMWKRPNSCLILVHWKLNFGIITLLCCSLVLAMPEQHQVYSGHRIQLACLWSSQLQLWSKIWGQGQGIGSVLVISISIRAVDCRYLFLSGEAVMTKHFTKLESQKGPAKSWTLERQRKWRKDLESAKNWECPEQQPEWPRGTVG